MEESSLLRWLMGAPLPPDLLPSPLHAPPLVLLLVTLPPSPSEDDTEDRPSRWALWLSRGDGGQERSQESQ